MSPSASEWRITSHPACSSLSLRGRPMNPEAPVTRTVLFIREKRPSVLFKLIDCPFVIVGPADVEPVTAVRFDVHRFPPCQHVAHQVVEPVFDVGWHALHQRTVYDVYAHAHQIPVRGFFTETAQPVLG